MIKNLCKDCRFFNGKGFSGKGICHFNPPGPNQQAGGTSVRRVYTYDDNWCNEWKPSDESLIEQYPALKEAYENYEVIYAMIAGET